MRMLSEINLPNIKASWFSDIRLRRTFFIRLAKTLTHYLISNITQTDRSKVAWILKTWGFQN